MLKTSMDRVFKSVLFIAEELTWVGHIYEYIFLFNFNSLNIISKGFVFLNFIKSYIIKLFVLTVLIFLDKVELCSPG